MFAQERYEAIQKLLSKKRRMVVSELQEALKISPATLRRDLAEMEGAGMIVRVHGGILHPAGVGELSLSQKRVRYMEAKSLLASEVCKRIPDRATVFIDSGTTCLEVGRLLLRREDLTLITNSVPLLQLSLEVGSSRVISIGGALRKVSGALTGGMALQWMKNVNADISVVSASGLSLNEGVSTTELEEAGIKQSFLSQSKQRILVADASKWNVVSTIKFAEWKDFSLWVTDAKLTKEEKKILNKESLEIVGVKANEKE